MKRTFKDKVLDIICNQGFVEEGKFHDTGDVKYLHRMEMCETLREAIEALEDAEDCGNESKNKKGCNR